MSHVVLARKYRPRSFEQMVGQAHVVQALSHALSSGRLHHAYLFTGTRGIGKTTVSRILAKSLNCTGPDGQGGVTAHPCGQCQACTEIDADRYIDYIELDAASNRSIDEIRELIERAAYKPSVGRFKVFMIDEAHQLTKDAFNALLKTLEEPPDYLKFVLATTDPDKMLPTVLSRCLQFNLRPMAPETVQEHLQQVLAAEGVAAETAALRLLSRAARGSMRDALSLTDQAIAYGGGQLQEASVRAMLGTVDRSHAAMLVQALAQRDGPAVLATLAELRAQGLSPAGTLESVANLLQQMAIEQAVPGALDDTDPDTAGTRQLAGELPADETQLLYSIVLHGRAELSLVSDEHAALTMVLLRFLAFPPVGTAAAALPRAAPLVASPSLARATAPVRAVAAMRPADRVPVAAPVRRVEPSTTHAATDAAAAATPVRPVTPVASPAALASAESVAGDTGPPPWVDDELPEDEPAAVSALRPATSDAAAETAATDAADAPPLVRPTALGQRWADTLIPLIGSGAVTAMVRELALQAELVACSALPGGGHQWRLRVARETLRSPSLAGKLAAAMHAALGEPVQIDTEAGTAEDSIALRDAVARHGLQRAAEQAIRHDPAVQSLMASFPSARIVPGSIRPAENAAAASTPPRRQDA
jgi:DNA polymerase III subunit gamma/tau